MSARQVEAVAVPPAAQAMGMRLLELPAELLERVVATAAGSRRGRLPFEAWTALAPVCRAFRAAVIAAVRRVVVVDCYALPRAYPTHAAFVDAARRVLRGPLLRCASLTDLDVAACDALCDDDIAFFVAKTPARLNAFSITVCHMQTDASTIAIARSAGRALRTVDISGCDRLRHGAMSPSVSRAARHVPCHALSNTSIVALSTFCSELRQVSISNSLNITDTALAALATIRTISDVLLRRLPSITDQGIRLLANGNGRLTRLSILSNTALGDETMFAIIEGKATRHSLRFFGLTFNYGVSDDGIAALVEGVPTLEELQLDHCAQVSDNWTIKVQAGGGLSRVSMRAVGLALTAGGLEQLACIPSGPVTLRALNLGFVSSVNAATLAILLETAPQLEVLILDACGNVDDEAAAILGQFPEMTTLDLSWCTKLTSRGVRALCNAIAGPRLQRLSIGPISRGFPDSVEDVNEDSATGEDDSDFIGEAPDLAVDGVMAEGVVQVNANATPTGMTAASATAEDAVLPEFDASVLAHLLELSATGEADHIEVPSSQQGRIDGESDVSLPRNGVISMRDAALYEVGAKCTSLRELILCGGVQPSTVAWLRRHSRARIDYMDTGICSSVYQPDEGLVN